METAVPVETNPVEPSSKTYRDGIVDTVTVVSICALLNDAYDIWFVIPKFTDVFKSFRVELPPLTRFFLFLSHSTSLVFIFLGAGILLLEFVRRTHSRRWAFAVMILVLAMGPLSTQSVFLPIYKIQDQLRQK